MARGRTLSAKALRRELRRERLAGVPDQELLQLISELDAARPRTRAECRDGPRPCPFMTCRHNLYLDVNPSNGSVKLNFPNLEFWELAQTCALDVAESGGITLEAVASVMNVTRERVRQMETRGLVHLRRGVEGEPT